MHISDAVRTLDRDLHGLFGARLQSVIVYSAAHNTGRTLTPTLAVIDTVAAADLRACASRVAAWHEAGLATPLVLAADEFTRSLDVFPFEFSAILADHVVVSGANLFDGLQIDRVDLRRACEIQARGHLLHLREGYIETEGRSDAVASLISRSVGALAALLRHMARLMGGPAQNGAEAAAHVERAAGLAAGSLTSIIAGASGSPLSSDEARRLFPEYLTAMERLTTYIDRWQG